MQLQTTIDCYTVDLDTDMEGHGAGHPDAVTGCWISYRSLSASLEALMAEGTLTNASGKLHDVAQSDIDQIESWALAHGY